MTQVSTGAGTATYRIDIAAYAVTVTTTTGRSWVSIGAAGKKPTFDGVMNPNSSQKELLLGPSEVDVGAGGTKVIVTSGQRTFTLTPPSAPVQLPVPGQVLTSPSRRRPGRLSAQLTPKSPRPPPVHALQETRWRVDAPSRAHRGTTSQPSDAASGAAAHVAPRPA